MRVLQALLLICAAALTLQAQATLGSATIGGTVRDASGAAVPEAKVVLTETARGLSREATANSAGSFLFPSVAPGVYFLRVTKEAFDAYELKGIQVEVGQLATLDVSLKVGQISTVVSVSAEKVILLETESNAIGTVVDSAQVESLPLNGREMTGLSRAQATRLLTM
jgi:Carboxypeptidase regulatory-like domain